MGWLSDAVSSVKDAVSSVGDIFSDPIGAFGDILEGTFNVLTFGGYQFAKDALIGLFDIDMPYQDRTRMVRAAAGSRQIVYGHARVGGQLVYIESWGKNRRFITMTIVVASHKVEEISAVYANGRKIASARSSGNGAMPAVTDGKYNTGPGNGVRAFAWSADGTQTTWIPATLTPSGVPSNPPNWTSSHILNGQAYVHVAFFYNEDKFESGLPKVQVELKGKNDIYDPRTGTTGYTDNQALCVLDAIRWDRMMDVPDADIDMPAFSAAADIADELVASGVGTTERRYTVNGTIPIDRPPLEVVLSLSAAGAGVPVYTQGQWTYSPGAFSAPVMTLDESDLVGGLKFQPGPPKQSRHNMATGTYIDIGQNFEELEFPQLRIQAYVDQDLEELEKTFSFPFTSSGTMARRLAKVEIERNRFGTTVQLTAKFKALRLTPGDRVALDNVKNGWNGKVFRVEDIQFSFESGVALTLREDAPEIYDWAEGEAIALDPPPTIQIPDGLEISPPEGLSASDAVISPSNGDAPIGELVIQWDDDPDNVASAYDIQYKRSESPDWIDAASFWQASSVSVAGIFDGTYDIRVRAITQVGIRSDWAQIQHVVSGLTSDAVAALGLEELTYTPRDPDAVFSTVVATIVQPADPDFDYALIEYRRVGDPDWIRVGPTNVDQQVRVVIEADGQQYEFRAFSVATSGIRSSVAVSNGLTLSNATDFDQPNIWDRITVPPVHGLELTGQGNDDEFTGRDAKLEWRKTSVDQWLPIGSEGFAGASGGNLDQFFRDYQVEVWADNKIVRTEFVVDPIYVYAFEKNAEDYKRETGTVGAWRTFEVRIYARSRVGTVSDKPARLTVSNPAPSALSALSVLPGFSVIEISYLRPDDLDFAGVDIWVSTVQGFDPDTTEPTATVSDNSYVVGGLADDTAYYVRVRPFDLFGRTGTNTSAEFAVTTKTGQDLSGLSGWAYEVDPVSREFIQNNIQGGAIDLGDPVVGGQLGTAKLADLSVQAAKLANGAVDLSGAKITGQLAGVNLANAAVDTAKLADLSVESAKLAGSAVTSTKIANLAVGTAAIANAAITNAKIGNLAVDSAQINDAAVISAKIANLAVGTAAIDTAAVTNAKIANLAVDTAKIQDAAIQSAKIGDLQVTDAKIVDLTAAKITTGTLNATETITSEGVIRAVDSITSPQIQTGIGPLTIDGTTYLLWGYNAGAAVGDKLRFGIDELGNATFNGGGSFNGTVSIGAGSSGVANLSDAGALATKSAVDMATTEVLNKTADNIGESTTRKWAGESGADVTANNTAAGFVGQGALSTLDNIDLSLVTDAGELAGLNSDAVVFIGAAAPDPAVNPLWQDTSTSPDTLKRWNGTAWDIVATLTLDLEALPDGTTRFAAAEAGADVTANNTAANIVNQGTLATLSAVGNDEITFNYATSVSKGGNAVDTDNVSGTSAATVKDGAVKANAGLDASGSVTQVIQGSKLPTGVSNATGGELLATNQYLGWHNGNGLASGWMTYIKSDGQFHFGDADTGAGTDNFIDYNGSTLAIKTDSLIIDTGQFSLDAAGNSTFGGELVAASGVFGDEATGEFIRFQGGIFEVGPNASIGSNASRAVTVGAGGDFATLNLALESLSRTVPAYKSGGFTASVEVLSGYVESEPIIIDGINLGWVTITSAADNLNVDGTAIGSTNDWFVCRNGAVGPTVDCSVTVSSAGVGKLFYAEGSSSISFALRPDPDPRIVLTGNSSDYAVWCEDLSRVSAARVKLEDFVEEGFCAMNGGEIDATGSVVSITPISYRASGGGRIYAANGEADVSNVAILCRGGSFVDFTDGVGRGGNTGCASSFAEVVLHRATLTGWGAWGVFCGSGKVTADESDVRASGSSSPNDLFVTNGGIITAKDSLGGTSVTPNTITPDGIIFK